jgi:hypothetical protein
VALIGLLLSASLATGGMALVVRAVAVETTGARGQMEPGDVTEAGEGYLLLAVAFFVTSALPYTFARRVAQRSEEVAVGNDDRKGVLLLRSFSDDRLRMRAHRTARQHPLTRLRPSARDRFEEIVHWTLGSVGPVTALSQPGSRLQPLGATRKHFGDKDWKAGVERLIRESALIVLMVDDTDAVRDEVDMVRAEGAIERTLFVVPPVRGRERRKRLRWIEDLLGIGRKLSRLDRTTAVLLAQVSAEGEVRATTGTVP